MFETLQVLTVVLVAIVLTPALAHALELPGKMRLRKEEYFAVQPIYYPGFTIAGVAEPVGVLALLLLVFLTPRGTVFWFTLGAFLALLVVHLLYWMLTHPVNNFWLANFNLKGFSAGFFGSDPLGRGKSGQQHAMSDWTILRDRWEYSHVARAIFAMLSLILLVTAVAL